jgi:hypothetical protein
MPLLFVLLSHNKHDNMATTRENRTIYSAEYDVSSIVKGAAQAVEAYESVQKAEEGVTAAGTKMEAQVEKTGQAIDNVKKKLATPTELAIDVTKLNQVGTQLQKLKKQFDGTAANLAAFFDDSELEELDNRLKSVNGDFKQISVIVDQLSKKLLELEPNSKEFNELANAIKIGNQVIQEYTKNFTEATKAEKANETQTKSLRARLRELREELTRLEDAGEDETQQYIETQAAAARLTEQYDDMQQKIRILSAGEKYFNFGADAIQAAVAGYQVATGALELFGVASEDAEEAQRKLLAVLNLVQGIQQLRLALDEAGTIAVVANKLATDAYAASQRILTVVLGQTAAASTTLQAALITTGVGALVIGIGFLVTKILEWTDATNTQAKAQEKLNHLLENQQKILEGDLEIIDRQTKLRNERLKQRFATESELFASNQRGQLERLGVYDRRLAELSQQFATADIRQQYTINQEKEKVLEARKKEELNILISTEEERTRLAEERRKREENQQKILDQIAQFGKTEQEKELLTLKANYRDRAAELRRNGESTVNLTNLYNLQVKEVNAKYRKLRAEEERKYILEIEKMQLDAANQRISNMENEFDRETQEIKNEAKKQQQALSENQTNLLNDLLSQRTRGIITPEQYTKYSNELNGIFDDLFIQVLSTSDTKIRQVAAKKFQEILSGLENELDVTATGLDKIAVGQIQKIAGQYVGGQIGYEKYQRKLTDINRLENKKRLTETLDTLRREIELVTGRLNSSLPEEERKALQKQLLELQKQQNDANRQLAEGDAAAKKDTQDRNKQHLDEITAAYQSFAQGIIAIINAIDQAEARRLDRQISYQEKRVEYARQIADKGNAEYLEMEEKKLDELQRKREDNANKQLAINNALTLSNAVLAAISAVAYAAQTGNPFAAIAAVGAIAAAIAAAYQFANSFDNPVQEFNTGTEYVNGPAGRDQVPARLTRGERVITVKDNADYWPTLEAMRSRAISPEVLNDFVNSYPNQSLPQVDMVRLGNATETALAMGVHETNMKLDRLTETLENWQPVQVNTSMDAYGFATSVSRSIKKQSRLKRS